MGSAQRSIALSRFKKEVKKEIKNTSPATVFKPDADGNFVEIEVVEPIFVVPEAKRKRPRVPRGQKSLL